MSLEFNIIYAPGTVKYLSFFVWSLLKHGDVCFRMVSNGCLFPEQQHLKRLCSRDSRLEYWAIPTKDRLPHGHALNYLHAMCRADRFCFLDSDVFAAGDYLTEIMSGREEFAAVFSGLPTWVKPCEAVMPSSFQHMIGTFHSTDTGLCLGSTYFAIYDNYMLTSATQSSGIGFEERCWSEIPIHVQEQLRDMNLIKNTYDTGKLLNLILLAQKARLIYVEAPSLYHIGGTSFQVEYDSGPSSLWRTIMSALTSSPFFASLQSMRRHWPGNSGKQDPIGVCDEEFRFNVLQRLHHRNPARQYALKLLDALFHDTPPPQSPITGDGEIDLRIREAGLQLLRLFETYRGKAGF